MHAIVTHDVSVADKHGSANISTPSCFCDLNPARDDVVGHQHADANVVSAMGNFVKSDARATALEAQHAPAAQLACKPL